MAIHRPAGIQDVQNRELLAMLELMYLVAKADGFFSADERAEFIESMGSLSEGKIERGELARLVDRWAQEGPERDVDARLRMLAENLPDITSRRIAYGLAVQMAEADGKYLDSEAALVRKIAGALGLEEEASEEIAHSVRMSSRPRRE